MWRERCKWTLVQAKKTILGTVILHNSLENTKLLHLMLGR